MPKIGTKAPISLMIGIPARVTPKVPFAQTVRQQWPSGAPRKWVPGGTPMRNTGMQIGFLIWGTVGFLFMAVMMFGIFAQSSVSVGTSAFAAMWLLFWIGGMIFFGLGDLCYKSRELRSS
jgi:hypothetical protein